MQKIVLPKTNDMKKTTATLAAALLCGMTALQAQSWKAYERTALQDEAYARHDCVNLLDSTSVTVQPSGQGSFAVCRAVKVQTPAGALRQRVLKYDYDPLTAAARFRRVTVHHADGTKTEVDVSKTLDYAAPARAIYWGARQIMIELGQLKPGDVIDYEIDKKGFTYALLADMPQEDDDSRFIPPMRGQFYDIVPFWSGDPTVRKVYRVSLPGDKDMQFQFYQGSCTSSLRYEDGRKVYTFASDGLMPFRREPNMVDFYDAAPKLMMSTTADWRDKSRWFYGVNEDYGSFTAIPEAQRKVDELIRGKKTDMEKIAVLTHWVADNIRYAGITMGKGEGFTLHNLKMPLDPTWVPFCRELWSSAEQQQNYLPGTPEGTDLCLTPVSAPENHYVRIHADNRLADNGTLRGSFTIEAEGQSDSNIRRIFTTGFQTEWQNTMERQLLNVSPKARLLSVDYGRNPKDYQKAPIRITFRYEIPGYALAGDGGEMVFKPFVLNNLYTQVMSYLRIDTSLETRQYGFKDGCSRLVELDETLRLPSGYLLAGEPRHDNLSGQAADFDGSIAQEGNRLTVKTRLALKKRVYEAADWDSFRQAVNTAKSYGQYLVVKK